MLISDHTKASCIKLKQLLLYCKLHIYYFNCLDAVAYVTRRVSDP